MVRHRRGQLGVKARVLRAAAQLGALGGAPPQRRARAKARGGARVWPGQVRWASGMAGGRRRAERVGYAK
jgi:hypothetical protein